MMQRGYTIFTMKLGYFSKEQFRDSTVIQSLATDSTVLQSLINAGGSSGADGSTLLPPRLEVPTVALVAGVNMPDHDVLFEQLRTIIRMDGISPHVVLLKSKDCNSGIQCTCT